MICIKGKKLTDLFKFLHFILNSFSSFKNICFIKTLSNVLKSIVSQDEYHSDAKAYVFDPSVYLPSGNISLAHVNNSLILSSELTLGNGFTI